VSTGTERGSALIYRERIERIDCDGDGNALALISKIVGELSEILDGYEGLNSYFCIGINPKRNLKRN